MTTACRLRMRHGVASDGVLGVEDEDDDVDGDEREAEGVLPLAVRQQE